VPYVEYDEVEAICSDCGRIFRSEEALSAHREESHAGLVGGASTASPSPLKCPECDREFDSPDALRVHRGRSHRG
jgi:uncharacterized C2H2 Zn-finger protein